METQKISIKLNGISNEKFSGWNLNGLIKTMTDSYYKLDVLNAIMEELHNGISPENILIFDRSFNIKNSYRHLYYNDILRFNNETSIRTLYSFGKPSCILPNRVIIEYNYIFKVYEALYTLINKYGRRSLPKSILSSFIEGGLSIADSIMQEYINNCDIMDKYKPEILKRSTLIIEKNLKKFNEFSVHDFPIIKNIIDKIECEKFSKDEVDQEIYRKYFYKFHYYLNAISRPVVGVLDNNTGIRVLKAHYMYDKEQDDEFKITEFTHNSPITMSIICGITIIPVLKKVYTTLRSLDDIEDEIEIENDNITKLDEAIHDLEKNVDHEKYKIPNKFIENTLNTDKNLFEMNFYEELKNSRLVNSSIEVKVIYNNND